MTENTKEPLFNSSSSFTNIMQEIAFQITSILSIEFHNIELDSSKSKLSSKVDIIPYINEFRHSISFTKMKIINQITSLIDKYSHGPLAKDNDLIIYTSLINELESMSKVFKVKINQYEITNDLLDFHLNTLHDQINDTSSSSIMTKCLQLKEEMNGIIISLEESFNNYNEQTKESLMLLKNNYMIMANNDNNSNILQQQQQCNMKVCNSSSSFKTYSNGKTVVKTKGKIATSGIPMAISISTTPTTKNNNNGITQTHNKISYGRHFHHKNVLRNSHKSLKNEIAVNTDNLSKSIEIMKKKNALNISKLARNQSPIVVNTQHSLSPCPIKTIEVNNTPMSTLSNNSNTINVTSGGNSNSYYKSKIQEQIIEINKLKQSLIKEQSQKIALKSDVTKLRAKLSETVPMPLSSSMGFDNNSNSALMKSNIKHLTNGIIPNGNNSFINNNNNHNTYNNLGCSHTSIIKTLKSKLDKFTEMILRFSLSMSSLHDAVFKKNSNPYESKAFYEQLKLKLQGLTNDCVDNQYTLHKLTQDTTLINDHKNNSNRNESNKDEQINNVTLLIHENNQLKEKNNSLREYNQQLTEKIITFRSMDGQQYQFQSPTPPSEPCDIIEIRKRMDELQKENIKMKQNMLLSGHYYHNDLPEDDDDNDDSKDKEKEEIMNVLKEKEKQLETMKEKEDIMMTQLQSCEEEVIQLKRESVNYKSAIEEKEQEIKKLKTDIESNGISNSNSSGLLSKLKETHSHNITQLKQLYDKMLNEKTQMYTIQFEKCNLYEQEILSLKDANALLENAFHDQNINHELEISSIESDKIKLEMQIEELKSRISSTSSSIPLSSPSHNTNTNKEHDQLQSKIISLQSYIDSLNKTISSHTSHIAQQEQLHQSHLKIQEELNAQITKIQSDLIAKDTLITDIKSTMKETRQKFIEEINEKDNEIAIITQNHQNDLNELNIAIIKLKCQITKLQEENMTLTYSQRSQRSMQSLLYGISKFNISFQCTTTTSNTLSTRENDLLKKEMNDLKNQIISLSNQSEHSPSPSPSPSPLPFSNLNSNDEHELSFDGSSRLNFTTPNIFSMLNSNQDNEDSHRKQLQHRKEINDKQQKEELHLLKIKLRTTLEENKKMNKKLMELEDAANKIKEDYINVLRVAFEKFVAEIQLSVNAKQYANIVFKMMNYTDEDINDIYIAMGKKKGGGSYFGFLRK